MKAHQPTVRFNLAALALNNCTLTLTTFITATVTQFNNSAKVSPFIRLLSAGMFFFPQNHLCLQGFFGWIFNRHEPCSE